MKHLMPAIFAVPVLVVPVLLSAGCRAVAPAGSAGALSFERVRPVLEQNCLHCHGGARLPHMISFASTAALARLTGPGLWIVAGQPGQSRFYQVVAAGDTVPNAMPPTGHAISRAGAEAIRRWIAEGALLPGGKSIRLTPAGNPVRSR